MRWKQPWAQCHDPYLSRVAAALQQKGRDTLPGPFSRPTKHCHLQEVSKWAMPYRTSDLLLVRDNSVCRGCSSLFKTSCKSVRSSLASALDVHRCSRTLSSSCCQLR